MLHPVSSRASRTSDLRVQLFTILGLSTIANLTRFYPKTLLWIVQRHALPLYIDLETFTLLPGWIILMNLGARRQKSQVLRPCFDLSTILCQVYAGFLYHYLWSETR